MLKVLEVTDVTASVASATLFTVIEDGQVLGHDVVSMSDSQAKLPTSSLGHTLPTEDPSP